MEKYQKKVIKSLYENFNIKGKNILEIGGDLSYSVASYLVNNGAKHVTTININPKFTTKEISDKISAKNLSATELTKYYEEETFDVVFGIAILEHIDNISLLLKQIYSVLKNNGIVLLQGGPVWTCSIGHHVWVNCDQNIYRFNNQMQNPIPNWYHLILNTNNMKEYLIKEKDVPPQDADKIVDYIYDSKALSRIGYTELLEIFHQSPFKILETIQNYGEKPDDKTLDKLNSIFPDKQHNYAINGIQFLMQKQ